jgi:hypothetical protein
MTLTRANIPRVFEGFIQGLGLKKFFEATGKAVIASEAWYFKKMPLLLGCIISSQSTAYKLLDRINAPYQK